MTAVVVPEATIAGYVAPIMQIVRPRRTTRESRVSAARRLAETSLITLPPCPAWSPAVNVFDTGDAFVVIAELAGVGPDSLCIELDAGGNMLTLRGTRAALDLSHADRRGTDLTDAVTAVTVDEEIASGRFERTITFEELVEPSGARAVCRYGLLQLMVPKRLGRPRRRASLGAAGGPRLRAVAC